MKKLLFLTVGVFVLLSFSTADAALIGVKDMIGSQYPDILFNNSGTIVYDATTDQFVLDADDLKIVYSDGSFEWLSGPGVNVDIIIDLQVNDSGVLVGTGTMQEIVTEGEVSVKNEIYGTGTTLLTGDVYALGWGESGTELGMFDFLVDNVSGVLIDDAVLSGDVPTSTPLSLT